MNMDVCFTSDIKFFKYLPFEYIHGQVSPATLKELCHDILSCFFGPLKIVVKVEGNL